jgi:hypothetical protein
MAPASLVVLDIDQTLIDSANYSLLPEHLKGDIAAVMAWEAFPPKREAVFKRPHVDEFLTYCFQRFDAVAIWTHASEEWANFIVTTVLKRKKADFAFVWSANDKRYTKVTLASRTGAAIVEATMACGGFDAYGAGGSYVNIKELKKIYSAYPRFSKKHTIIVEDTPENCARNFGNAIYIPAFGATTSAFAQPNALTQLQQAAIKDGDNFLLKLCFYFESLRRHKKFCADVRDVEKRGWHINGGAQPGEEGRQYCAYDECVEKATCVRDGDFWCDECAKNQDTDSEDGGGSYSEGDENTDKGEGDHESDNEGGEGDSEDNGDNEGGEGDSEDNGDNEGGEGGSEDNGDNEGGEGASEDNGDNEGGEGDSEDNGDEDDSEGDVGDGGECCDPEGWLAAADATATTAASVTAPHQPSSPNAPSDSHQFRGAFSPTTARHIPA